MGLGAALVLRGDARTATTPSAGGRSAAYAPPLMLWAWEEPEDLRGIDRQRIGVAFLAERIFVGRDVRVLPRRQSVLVPDKVYAVAVARIEAGAEFADSAALRRETAKAILRAAALPGVRGVQVDFDATASQREFYADVLKQVRSPLPQGVGLTMTALVSWCAEPSGWMHELPVDAAVPMYFRLGEHVGRWEIREPLCAGSAGVSTDEGMAAPDVRGEWQVYVFAPKPWTAEQIAVLNRSGFPNNARGTR
jgi:hypothetical protein